MSRRIIKFKFANKPRGPGKVFIVIAAITTAVAIFSAMFLVIKFSGIIQSGPEYIGGPLRGVAEEDVLYTPTENSESDILLENNLIRSGWAFKGQTDVTFMDFDLTTREGGQVQKMAFSLAGYARPYDVSGVQLYMNEKFIGEKPLFEGRAVFDNMNLNLGGGSTYNFTVKGKVASVAVASDRILLGIASADDIFIRGNSARELAVGGEFPLWGRDVSVIGGKL